MPLFQYYFLTDLRKKQKGSIEANSLKEAKERLWEQQICVLKVIPGKISGWSFRNKLDKSSLISFSRQLLLLLSSGLPLYESLLLILDRYKTTSWESVLSFLAEKIKQGLSLSEGMENFPEVFSDFYKAMIVAGETVGKLEDSLQYNISFLEKEEQFRKQLLISLTYPCILFCFSVFIITSFLLFVIPSLKGVFQDFSVNWITQLVFSVSDLFCSYIYYFLFGSLCLVIASVGLFKQEKIRNYWERFLLSFPIFKGFFLKLAVGRFSRLLGTLLKGDVPIVEALKIAKTGVYPKILQSVLEQIECNVTGGGRLSKEFAKHAVFPKLLIEMIALGEETGRLSLVFSQLSDIYEEDTKKFLNGVVSWAQPVILIVLGGIIGLIMLAVLMPLTGNFSLNSF